MPSPDMRGGAQGENEESVEYPRKSPHKSQPYDVVPESFLLSRQLHETINKPRYSKKTFPFHTSATPESSRENTKAAFLNIPSSKSPLPTPSR